MIFGILSVEAQNVGIGTSTPLDYAKLDISSTTSGLQLPRMTTAQRTTLDANISALSGALSAQYSGMIVYDVTTNTMYIWDAAKPTNGAWVNILDSDASLADADADATNELQNLSSTASGTDRTINISSGTGTTISVADNDNSTTNEIQDLSLSGNTLSLSSDATTVDLSGFKDHDWYESPGTTQPDNIADNIYTNGNVAIGSTSATANMKLDVNGNLFARKYVVQNSTDGGPNNGIFMWDEGDSNWGIYMGQSGANKSLANGTAVAGGGFSQHAIRFRVANSTTQGFIFENASEQNLFSIRGSNGRATLKGGMLFDCNDCGSPTVIDGTSDYGDLTIQGRVLSANSNIHLSPPGGSSVIINDDYRAAGGAAGSTNLIVEGTTKTTETTFTRGLIVTDYQSISVNNGSSSWSDANCSDGWAITGVQVYSGSQLQGPIRVICANITNVISGFTYRSGNSVNGLDNADHVIDCNSNEIARGFGLFKSSTGEFDNGNLLCSGVQTGYTRGSAFETLTPMGGNNGGPDNYNHTAQCPPGSYLVGASIYASGRLDANLRLRCATISKN